MIKVDHPLFEDGWDGYSGKEEVFRWVLSPGWPVCRIRLARYISSAYCDAELLACFVDLFEYLINADVSAPACPPPFNDTSVVSKDFDVTFLVSAFGHCCDQEQEAGVFVLLRECGFSSDPTQQLLEDTYCACLLTY